MAQSSVTKQKIQTDHTGLREDGEGVGFGLVLAWNWLGCVQDSGEGNPQTVA